MDETAPPKDKPKSKLLRNGCLGVVTVFGGIMILGAIIGDPDPSKAPARTQTSESATELPSEPTRTKTTARELFNAYQDNQLAAEKKYEGQPLDVSGTVEAIDESFGSPLLSLATGNEFLPVRAEFAKDSIDQLAAMKKGAKVTVKCESLTEAAGFLRLNDCVL